MILNSYCNDQSSIALLVVIIKSTSDPSKMLCAKCTSIHFKAVGDEDDYMRGLHTVYYRYKHHGSFNELEQSRTSCNLCLKLWAGMWEELRCRSIGARSQFDMAAPVYLDIVFAQSNTPTEFVSVNDAIEGRTVWVHCSDVTSYLYFPKNIDGKCHRPLKCHRSSS